MASIIPRINILVQDQVHTDSANHAEFMEWLTTIIKEQRSLFDPNVEINTISYPDFEHLDAKLNRLDLHRHPQTAHKYTNINILISQEANKTNDLLEESSATNAAHWDLSAVRNSIKDHRPSHYLFQVYVNPQETSSANVLKFGQHDSQIPLNMAQGLAKEDHTFLLNSAFFKRLPRLHWSNLYEAGLSLKALFREVAIKTGTLSMQFGFNDLTKDEQKRISQITPTTRNGSLRSLLNNCQNGMTNPSRITNRKFWTNVFGFLAHGENYLSIIKQPIIEPAMNVSTTPSNHNNGHKAVGLPSKAPEISLKADPVQEHLRTLLKQGRIDQGQYEDLLAQSSTKGNQVRKPTESIATIKD